MATRTLVGVEVVGLPETLALLRRTAAGAAAIEDYLVLVGTNLVYAYGVHEGRRRGGRLARRAGGAFFLTRALALVAPTTAAALAAAVTKGPSAAVLALVGVGQRVLAEAVPLTPVRSGSLRRSLHTQLARRR